MGGGTENYTEICMTSLLDEEEERRGEERGGEETMTSGVTEACQVIMFLDPSSLGL